MDAKRTRANLVDVARHAGVSPATVSRVLNNSAPVRESVRVRVLASLTELGYEPPPTRLYSAPPHNSLALLVPDILNPFFAEILHGVQDEVGDDFFLTLFDTAENAEREREILRLLAGQAIAGLIVFGSRLEADDLAVLLARQNAPAVVFNRSIRQPNLKCIVADFESAIYRAARHLLDLNHTRIGYLAGPSASETSRARRRGVELALAEAGLSLRPEWCVSSFPNVDGGFQAMSALLARPSAERATAVIAYNDIMALGALHAIRAHRQRVPDDISVVGFDDITMAAHCNPPLTTVAQPKHRMGRLAIQMLRQMIQGHPLPSEGYVLVESPLIVRESTAPVGLSL